MQTEIILNVLTAASHANPYPYYAKLRQGPALTYDAEHKCWLASRADVVQKVLESAACAVRPATEPVPANIAGGSAGEVFSYLMRMNEGLAHIQPKQVMQTSLRSLDMSAVTELASRHAAQLATGLALNQGQVLTQYLFDLPVHVMGSILGLRPEALPELANWMADFVRCLSPLSTPAQIDAAHRAAQSLQTSFRQLLKDSTSQADSFLAHLQKEAQQTHWTNTDALLANITGLLSQTYEATAGLTGNSIAALHQHPELLQGLQGEKTDLQTHIKNLVAEVARFDAPVQNTRRFVTQACEISGLSLQAGDVIVVLLAAANRDPAANPDPELLQLQRTDRKVFTFGHGRHACPGQAIAEQIAAKVIMYLLDSPDFNWQHLAWTYRPSLNGRLPQFTQSSQTTNKEQSS